MRTTTTATSTSTSSSTLAPVQRREEICGDCVDNDADGLVDNEDPDCCAQPVATRIGRVRFLAGRTGLQNGRLRIRAVLAGADHADVDPASEDVTIQLRNSSRELLCVTIDHQLWVESRPRVFTFRDPGPAGQGLFRGTIQIRRRGGVELRLASPRIDLSRYDQADVEITVRVGRLCSSGAVPLHARGTKGFVFP